MYIHIFEYISPSTLELLISSWSPMETTQWISCVHHSDNVSLSSFWTHRHHSSVTTQLRMDSCEAFETSEAYLLTLHLLTQLRG